MGKFTDLEPLGRKYENRHGTLVARAVTPVMRVDQIHGKDIADEHKFDIDKAEQIVLITANQKSQIGFQKVEGGYTTYLVVHVTPSEAYVAKVEQLDYASGENAGEIIAREARSNCFAEFAHMMASNGVGGHGG